MAWAMFFGTVSFPFTLHAQTTGPTQSGTSIVPAISLSERYDTNIWLAPAQFLPPGTQLNDFATTLQGSLKVLHKDRDIEASVLGGLDGNIYAHNTGLNYFSTRADAFAILNGWAERLARGAQLRIYDYFRYTPVSPGFLTGGTAGTEDPFLRGIQSFRANTFSNTLNTDGLYPVFRGLGVQGGYSFSIFRVGSILAGGSTGATFFDTMVHGWSVGPRLQLSRTDNIAVLYQQSLISQTLTDTAGSQIDTNTQSVTANYTRQAPTWRFSVGGGVTLVEPASKAFPTAKVTISTNPERSTVLQIDLSRQAAPSFFLTAGAMISNVGQVQITHRPEKHLTLRASANYGFNEIIPVEADTKFTSFTLSAGLNYRITKVFAVDLYYDHNDFKTESPGVSYTVLRDVVGIALTAEWR
jgi:hypothetical protein